MKKKFWLALFLVFMLTVFAAFAETEQTDQGKAFDDVWVITWMSIPRRAVTS